MKAKTGGSIKAVIFDLDGTLVDSEPLYFESDRKLLSKFPQIPFDEEFKDKYVGIGARDMLTELKKIYGFPDEISDLLLEKNRLYMELARKRTRLFPEMKILLEKLKDSGFKLAVASGSSLPVIREILDLAKISKYFDCLTSAEEVPKGKPDPAVFLKTAQRLDVNPQECVVLEDSWPGLEAAQAASMPCIAIPTLTEDTHHRFEKADLLFKEGMESFSAEKSFRWIQSL